MSQEHVGAVNETSQGRDARGRFTAGNGGGPGNPFGRRLAMMRQAVMRAVSADDVEQLLRKLLEMAQSGDLAAAKLVLQYAVGKPKPAAEPDRVEIEAWENQKDMWAETSEVSDIVGKLPIRFGTVSSEVLGEARCKKLGEAIRNFDPNNPEAIFAEEPFTEEQLRAMEREYEELNARAEANLAERELANQQHVVNRPSRAGANGRRRPSTAGTNGSSRNGH